MRAQLSALVRIETALEQRAQDRRLNLRPVQRRCLGDGSQLSACELQRRIVVEQAAVEPLDPVIAEEAAGFAVGHPPKHFGEPVGKRLGIIGASGDHVGHQLFWQQTNVLGEEAEQHTIEEVRDRFGFVSALLHGAGEFGEARGRRFRYLIGGLSRTQRLRLAHHRAQDAQRSRGLVPAGSKVFERQRVDDGTGVGEVGMDLDPVHVADDERGRILQVLAVVKQLPIGGGEVGVVALVLPTEVSALPDVGPTPVPGAQSFGAGLEGVPLAGRIGLVRRLDAEHAAEVDEVLLRGGTLAPGVVAPLGGEFGCGE